LELLRFQQELRDMKEFDFPVQDIKRYKISKQEIGLAAKLVDGMTGRWRPEDFEDEYRAALLQLVEKKIATGKTEMIERDDIDVDGAPPSTINFMDVLKKSVAQSGKTASRKRFAGKRRSIASKRPAKKKRAS
jgi:DNA end-binding protein Ku